MSLYGRLHPKHERIAIEQTLDIGSGLDEAAAYSSSLLCTRRAGEKYGVATQDIPLEMARRRTTTGQQGPIEDVAIDLARAGARA